MSLNLPTQVSRVRKHFQKSVKLENIICSSNARLGILMRNHEKMVRNVFFCDNKILNVFQIEI